MLKAANVRSQALEEAVPSRAERETLPQTWLSLPFAADHQERPPQGTHNWVEAGTSGQTAVGERSAEVPQPMLTAARAPMRWQLVQQQQQQR